MSVRKQFPCKVVKNNHSVAAQAYWFLVTQGSNCSILVHTQLLACTNHTSHDFLCIMHFLYILTQGSNCSILVHTQLLACTNHTSHDFLCIMHFLYILTQGSNCSILVHTQLLACTNHTSHDFCSTCLRYMLDQRRQSKHPLYLCRCLFPTFRYFAGFAVESNPRMCRFFCFCARSFVDS